MKTGRERERRRQSEKRNISIHEVSHRDIATGSEETGESSLHTPGKDAIPKMSGKKGEEPRDTLRAG